MRTVYKPPSSAARENQRRQPRLRVLWALCCLPTALCVTGCGSGAGEDEDGEPASAPVLTPFADLSLVEEQADPLVEHRPELIDCNNLVGYFIEDGLLEVNTAECNYFAGVVPAAVSAKKGQLLVTEISYFDLTASAPAEAHVALLLEGVTIWETTIAIPSPADVIEISVPLAEDLEKGTLVGFHLHNHGQNSWNIAPLVVQDP